MIRLATLDDLSCVYSIGLSRFNTNELASGWTFERIRSLVSENHSYVFVKDNRIVGFCLASSQCAFADGCHIEWTAVVGEHRGAGARLFLHVLTCLRKTYKKRVFVDVLPSNVAVLDMLKRYGFHKYAEYGAFDILSV